MGGPKITKVQPESQASPLAEDILAQLQGILSEGGLGTGVGPQQRSAGTSIQQFVNALEQSLAGRAGGPPGGISAGLSQLTEGLTTASKARTDRSAADLREQGGIAGQRFGTSLAQGEGLLRSEADASLDQTIGGLLEQGRQFDTSLFESGRQFDTNALLQGISQLFNQGQANLSAFTNILPLGVFGEEVIASPGIFDQVLAGAIKGGSNLLLPTPTG